MINKYLVTALVFLFFLNVPFSEINAQCLLTNVSTTSGETEVTTCPGDGLADKVRFKPSTWASGYVWVITDTDNIILDFFYGNNYNFENAGPGVCRVWGVSIAGFVQVPVGEDINDGDFNSFCWVVSANYVSVKRVVPDAASVTLDNGDTKTYLCPGDGIPDILTFANTSQAGNDYGYVITDDSGIIIDAADVNGSYDFDDVVTGACRVYGVGYTGDLTITPGEDISNSKLSDNCYDLSDNFVEIIKDEPEGGQVATIDGNASTQICVNNGSQSIVEFSAANTSNLFYAYVITDEADNLLGIEFSDSHDFAGAPAGTCRVYGVAYVGNFTIQNGENIFTTNLTDNCFDLSENYVEVLRSEPNGSFVSLDDGTELIYTCPGDGNADMVSFSTSSSSTALYAFLITDEAGKIIQVANGNDFDFDGASPGTCRIYGISYIGNLLADTDMDIFTDNLADGCWDISNNFIEVVREIPDGGSILTTEGESLVYVCVGDSNSDLVEFEVSGLSNSNAVFVVTDESLEILNILNSNSFDFNSSDIGICRIYSVAYTGNFSLIEGQFLDISDISDDCADISDDYITIIKDVAEGGFVFANGGQELVYTCPGDGKADVLQLESTDASLAKFVYLILDDNLMVLDIVSDDTYDFDGLGEGLSAVYGLSYTGNLTVEVGDDPFFTMLSDDCYDLSDNWVDVIHFLPEAGSVATLSGATNIEVCSGDGASDLVEFEAVDAAIIPYFYVVTDYNDEILSFSPIESIDFETVPEGVCRIYGVSFTGNFFGIVGENINDILLSDDCYDLSDNYIEVTRKRVDGGEVSTSPLGETVIYVCPGDGLPNIIDFGTDSDAPTAEYTYVVTNNQNVITDILSDDNRDFEGDGIGISKVWGISYTGTLLAEVGDVIDEIALSDGCYSLSENFVEIVRDTPNGDIIVSNLGDNINICVNDGQPDEIAFITGSFSFAQYTFIITDEFNEVIEVMNDDIIYDFEDLPQGACRVWGLSYTGHLTVEPGDLADFDPLSDDCFSLSNNYVLINKTYVDGGTVYSPSGDEIFICAGDGNSDFVGFFNTSNSGNNYRYLVTDEDGVLLDVIGFNLYNFENSGAGVCRIYGLDLTGVLNVFVGDNIFEEDLSSDCFDLSSDFVTVYKDLPDGGTVSTDAGETTVMVSVNDGITDVINFISTDASNSKYQFVITDENNIVLAVLTDDFADFEEAEEGICRVWGVAYTGGISVEVGDVLTDVDLATGCFDLSVNFIEIVRDDPNNFNDPTADLNNASDVIHHSTLELSLSPNPVVDVLKVKYQSNDFEGVSEMRVFSAAGQLVYQTKLETYLGQNETSIQTSDFVSGTYFVSIRNAQEMVQSVFVKH